MAGSSEERGKLRMVSFEAPPPAFSKYPAAAFARRYAERSGVSVEWLREHGREVRPCDCGEDICEGWRMVREEHW